jgi:hypothetical protein
MVSVMMVTIKITDRGSGVSLRPMNSSSSDCSLAYIYSTEISKRIINGEKSLSESLFCYLLFCLFSIRITMALWLRGKKRNEDFFLRSLIIPKTMASSITWALFFRLSHIWQGPSEGSCPVICISSPHYHAVE